MPTNDELAGELRRLAWRVEAAEAEIARLARLVERPHQTREAGQVSLPSQDELPPWKLDAAALMELVERLCVDIKENPLAAFSFERAGNGSYLARHSRNVARLAVFLAARQGLSDTSVRTVGLCALLHDAGMDCVEDGFISESRPLAPHEYRKVREHPSAGAAFVRENFIFGGLLDSVVPAVIEQHHERCDGSGYPHGLQGERIHDFARILAVADSFEAMTTPRPFRSPQHPSQAVRSLLIQGYRFPRGGMYDRKVLRTFVDSASLHPLGCWVKLSDGSSGIVCGTTADPKRPIVKLSTGEKVNLRQRTGIEIVDDELSN